MKAIYADTHLRHAPQFYFKAGGLHEHPEKPERAEAIVSALREKGYAIALPRDFGAAPRAAVHTPEYLAFLETVHSRWQEIGPDSPEVMPNIHPGRHMASMPDGLVGQIGYFTADMSSPIGPDTWEAACQAANVALSAAREVLDGADSAYGLCRPPGHHAFPDMAGGFCFLNNIAIAAQYAAEHGRRPAIVDVDVHAGNGTQGVFYERADVLTVSLHCDPLDFYPYFAGHAHERGAGAGLGRNLNLPLPKGTGDNAYLVALDRALGTVKSYGADILFVALGLDGYEKDPFEGFKITTPGFGRIARAIGELGLPTVMIQEGGYNCADLGANVASFLEGFASVRGGGVP